MAVDITENSAVSEITIGPFKQKHYAECREMCFSGLQASVISMTKIVFCTYLPYALALLVVVAAIRWSVVDVMIYLGICAILTFILYLLSNWSDKKYAQNVLDTDLLDIAEYYKDGSCMFVAELNDKVVGMCGVIKKDHHKPGEAELQRMSVSPVMRKRGIGTKLIKAVEEFCKEQKYNKLILTTLNSFHGAMVLYIKCGFKVTRRFPFPNKVLQGINEVKFEKDIILPFET